MSDMVGSAEYYSNLSATFEAIQKTLAENIVACLDINNISKGISILVEALPSVLTENYIQSVQNAVQSLFDTLNELEKSLVDTSTVEVQIQNYQNTKETIENVFKYVDNIPEASKKKTVLQSLKENLTLDRVLLIIQILLSIYFFIVQSMPDEQLDRIIEQNDIIIEQQSDQIDIAIETNELLHRIEDAICDLSADCERSSEGKAKHIDCQE